MNKSLIRDVLSISCVENYFMGWCKVNDISLDMLYNQSYEPIGKCAEAFLKNGASYESYNGIKRIQETAEEYGIVTHKYYSVYLLGLIKTENIGNNLLLIQVNKKFFNNIQRAPWREDHYICITEKNGNNYKYINNYPFGEGILTFEQLNNVFGGSIIVFKKTGCFDIEKIVRENNKQINNIIYSKKFEFCDIEQKNFINLRDCIGILKISRQRIKEWIKYISNLYSIIYDAEIENCLLEEINELNKLFTYLELQNLRNKFDKNKTFLYLKKICNLEENLKLMIKMRRITDEKTRYY